MSELFQKARELGNLILESEESIRVSDAAAVFNASEISQKKMNDYQEYQSKVQEDMKAGKLSKEEYMEASKKLTEMVESLKKDSIIGALIFAENEFNGLINNVINILRATITGEASPENGCGGHCCEDGCDGCH